MSKNQTISRFNLRVYAIIIKDDKVLLSDEQMGVHRFTKFPGGGVELGEGVLSALHRELKEELEAEILRCEHFYTTDFFQQSAFNSGDQIISVYYLVELNNYPQNNTNMHFGEHHRARFFYQDMDDHLPEYLNFPIDKIVSKILIGNKI